MARPLSELTKLILSLPADMPVVQVIAKAKEKGMTTSKGNVHQVRSKYGGKRGKGALHKPTKAAKAAPSGAAKKGKGQRSSPKKEAILAIGLDKPTSQIIAAAKAKGVAVSDTYVDILKKAASGGSSKRSNASPKAAKKNSPKPGKAAAPKKRATSTPAGDGGPSKSDYIRSFGADVKASQIVASAKKAGLKLNADYVYKVRRLSKHSKKKGHVATPASAAPKRGPGRPRKVAVASLSSGASADHGTQGFRRLVLELGVAQARQLVEDVARKLAAIVAG